MSALLATRPVKDAADLTPTTAQAAGLLLLSQALILALVQVQVDSIHSSSTLPQASVSPATACVSPAMDPITTTVSLASQATQPTASVHAYQATTITPSP